MINGEAFPYSINYTFDPHAEPRRIRVNEHYSINIPEGATGAFFLLHENGGGYVILKKPDDTFAAEFTVGIGLTLTVHREMKKLPFTIDDKASEEKKLRLNAECDASQ